MKNCAMLLLGFVLLGCNALSNSQVIIPERNDVFREVSKDSPVPPGSVMLTVKAEIKTHHKDFYLLESRNSPHGRQQYPILINIDGQQAFWEMPGMRDDTAMYDELGDVTPEGGKGMKYMIEKKLSVSPGRHQVAIALPGDEYGKKIEITLPQNRPSLLEFKPVYEQGGIGHHENFLHGIRQFDVYLNEQQIE